MTDGDRCFCGHLEDKHHMADDPELEACDVCVCRGYEWDGEPELGGEA